METQRFTTFALEAERLNCTAHGPAIIPLRLPSCNGAEGMSSHGMLPPSDEVLAVPTRGTIGWRHLSEMTGPWSVLRFDRKQYVRGR
ncbi:MAG: hypothetical protein ABL908_17840, partial [Hyphomicrobium sp.]